MASAIQPSDTVVPGPAERHPASFTARKRLGIGVRRRKTKCIHRDLESALEVPAVDGVDLVLHRPLAFEELGHLVITHGLAELHAQLVEVVEKLSDRRNPSFHRFEDGLGVTEIGLLRQVADVGARSKPGFASEVLVEPRHDAEQ